MIGLVTHPVPAGVDRRVADELHLFVGGRPWLEDTLHVVAVVSHPWVLRVLALAAAVALWRHGRRRPAVWLVVTMAVGGALGGTLKLVFGRDRPVFDEPLAIAAGYSFPSGHALNSMLAAGCALVLLHPRTRGGARAGLWAAAAAFVLLVGFDRVGLGVHYLSDVVAGWVVALTVLAATVVAFRPRGGGP